MCRSIAANILEPLEARQLRAAVYPTAYEQYAVELINRARANPVAEATRLNGYQDRINNAIYNGDLNEGLSAGTISADAKQPLAINLTLTDAARAHSAWMIANSTFDHFEGRIDPGDRMDAAGYPFPSGSSNAAGANWGENLAGNWSSNVPDPTSTASDQQDALFTDQSVGGDDPRGHRTNMMDATRNEVGVGFASGIYNYPGQGNLNGLVQTADTATDGQTFLTGVAYSDTVSQNQFYTPGEGLGGITITATRVSDGRAFTTTTWASGGYSLPLGTGTYDIVGSGTALGAPVHYTSVSIGTQNVKEDFVAGQAGTATGSVFIRSQTLVVMGSPGNDVIGVYVDSGNYLVGLNGAVTKWATSLADAVAIKAGDGNDKVVIGVGVLKDYVEGGYGRDTLIGGGGSDTLYGNASIDLLEGNGGNDFLVGENGGDLIYGGLGRDTIYGGYGNDTIDAGGGNDRVYGGPGDDFLAGGKGHDYLIGSTGHDTLNGGAHDDYGDNDPDDTRISIEILI